MKDPFFHCSKCEKHINELANAGKYLKRTSELGTDFEGQCEPCCEYHEIKTNGNTALLNCLEDNTQ